MGNAVARVSPDPLNRPRITRSTSSGHSRAAPVGAQVPWTTWGRFAHDSPRARVEVHLPRVLESRSAGQRALAPPTDGHPPGFRQPQRQFNHYTTAFRPRYDATNRHSTTTFSQPFAQPSNNRFLAPRQPSETSTPPQPSFKRHSTATQPRDNHNNAAIVSKSHSSRPKPPDGQSLAWQTPTTQPSFVSNPRTISTQPSHSGIAGQASAWRMVWPKCRL